MVDVERSQISRPSTGFEDTRTNNGIPQHLSVLEYSVLGCLIVISSLLIIAGMIGLIYIQPSSDRSQFQNRSPAPELAQGNLSLCQTFPFNLNEDVKPIPCLKSSWLKLQTKETMFHFTCTANTKSGCYSVLSAVCRQSWNIHKWNDFRQCECYRVANFSRKSQELPKLNNLESLSPTAFTELQIAALKSKQSSETGQVLLQTLLLGNLECSNELPKNVGCLSRLETDLKEDSWTKEPIISYVCPFDETCTVKFSFQCRKGKWQPLYNSEYIVDCEC